MVASSAYYQLIGERFEYSGTSLHTVLGSVTPSPSSAPSAARTARLSSSHTLLPASLLFHSISFLLCCAAQARARVVPLVLLLAGGQ